MLERSANHGDRDAQFFLGQAYEERNRIPEALESYRKAAGQGVLQAAVRLGDLLSDGVSTTPDYVEAWAWLSVAAERGDRISGARAQRLEEKLTAEQLKVARRRLKELH